MQTPFLMLMLLEAAARAGALPQTIPPQWEALQVVVASVLRVAQASKG